METMGDLAQSMNITVEELCKDVEPEVICVHNDTCSFGNCPHRWPHHAQNEIETCDYELCMNMGVVACCTPITG